MVNQEQYINNLLYFEGSTMRALYDSIKRWQDEDRIYFRSLSIEQDGENFCCIAVVNPEHLKQKITKTKYEETMARFQRKALRNIVNEKKFGGDVEFVDDTISPEKIRAIQSKLKECTTALEIKAVFREEF